MLRAHSLAKDDTLVKYSPCPHSALLEPAPSLSPVACLKSKEVAQMEHTAQLASEQGLALMSIPKSHLIPAPCHTRSCQLYRERETVTDSHRHSHTNTHKHTHTHMCVCVCVLIYENKSSST